MRTSLAVIAALIPVACTTHAPKSPQDHAANDQGVVTYRDRNRDGLVDYEMHDFGCCDRNRALVDSDFDGRYDLERRWGESYAERPVDPPVATGVAVSTADPPALP